MRKIDTSKLAEQIIDTIHYAFDSYYTQGNGDIELQEIIKQVINDYIKTNNKS